MNIIYTAALLLLLNVSLNATDGKNIWEETQTIVNRFQHSPETIPEKISFLSESVAKTILNDPNCGSTRKPYIKTAHKNSAAVELSNIQSDANNKVDLYRNEIMKYAGEVTSTWSKSFKIEFEKEDLLKSIKISLFCLTCNDLITKLNQQKKR